MEVPCYLVFTATNEREANKTKGLISASLGFKIVEQLTLPFAGIESAAEGSSCGNSEMNNDPKQSTIVSSEDGTTLVPSKVATISISTAATASVEDLTSTSTSPIDLTVSKDLSPSPKKQRFDEEGIIMGLKLSDRESNLAQQMLKSQFSQLNGFHSTLLQSRMTDSMHLECQNKIQVIFCQQRRYWIVGTTINCEGKEVKVYDSFFTFLDQESMALVIKLFMSDNFEPTIKTMKCQRQQGPNDCGLFAVANATALAFGLNPTRQIYKQDTMRLHFVHCLTKGNMLPFPCI